MRSGRHWTGAGRGLPAFAIAFTTLLVLGAVAMRGPMLRPTWYLPVPPVVLPDASWHLASRGFDTLADHHLLWDGLEPLVSNARQADVLFLGDSRMQFAFPEPVLRKLRERRGLRAFNLAAAGESRVFMEQLIERFDLRPRIVVVDASGFFRGSADPVGARVRSAGPWGGDTRRFEDAVATRLWPVLSEVFPSFNHRQARHYLLRSDVYGSWRPVHWPHYDREATTMSSKPPRRWPKGSRLEFRARMLNRGTRVVITCIPVPGIACSAERLQASARGLGVAGILPPLEGLTIGDLTHLCARSGKRFARLFLQSLFRLDMYRQAVRQGTAPQSTKAP